MKKILLLLLVIQSVVGQSIEYQTEILSRKPCIILNSYREYKKLIEDNRVDYVMVTNIDTVNIFYYQNGEINVLRPAMTDVLLSVRDDRGKVIDYPYLFFDKSSWDKRVNFRVGICDDCKNSSLGAKYGALYRKAKE